MRVDLAWLRDPYRPGVGPVVQPWIQPLRRNLLAFRRYWPWMRLAATSVLIILATLPMQVGAHSWLVALFAVGMYWLAMFGFELVDHYLHSPVWRQHLGGIRKLAGLLALMVVHWWLPAANTELWLLYLIPMMTLGVDLDRFWATFLISLTMVLMFLSAWPFAEVNELQTDWGAYIRSGLIRAVISGYAGLTSYLLSRCLAYQSNNTREVLSRLFDLAAADAWFDTQNAVARSIAAALDESTNTIAVHILTYEPKLNIMRLIGSSTSDGEMLAQEGYKFNADQGITGWAARHQKPCFINDTRNDPEHRFLAHRAFSEARSALAVPLRLDDRRSVVLYIESPIANGVAFEDLQLMNHVAHYLLASDQRSKILEFHKQLAKLGASLADRIIRVEDVGAMLEEIGQVALDLLNADVIRFYYRNPETGLIEKRRTVGELIRPDTEESPANDPESLVFQLMEEFRLQPFPTALQDERLTRRLHWHEQRSLPPFVVREAIHSCAAMPLVVGQEKLGLMWVNFRRLQELSDDLC